MPLTDGLGVHKKRKPISRRENTLRAIRRQNPQWVPNGLEAVVTIRPPLVERPLEEGLDAFGVSWSLEAGAKRGALPTAVGRTISSIHRWREELRLPDLNSLDWNLVKIEAEAIDREEYLLQGFVEMGLFERSYLLLGPEEALMSYLTDPEEMRALLHVLADYKIAIVERFFAATGGLDLVWYGDDWGAQTRLLLPPDAWRATIKPETARVYAAMKSRGIIINQHSCGKIEEILGDLVEMGADLWSPCQPCNDLARLKSQYGDRISFCGGIDSQSLLSRPGATPQDVRDEVERRITEMSRGGGYIAAPSHSLPDNPKLLQAMNEAIAFFGRAVYGS